MSLTPTQLAALLASPALAAPNGTTANFVDPPNENGLAYFVTSFCMIIATVSCFIRGYTKICLVKAVRVEEILMLGAYVRRLLCLSNRKDADADIVA